jgi:hypothetical protein
MNAIAKPGGRARSGGGGNRQVIVLVGLCVVLAAVLAFELPKVLGHSGSGSADTASTPAVATTTPVATAASASVPATATGSSASATASVAAAVRTERWIKRRPARDPFVPLVVASSASSAAASSAAPTPSSTPPASTPAASTQASAAAIRAAAAAAAAETARKFVPSAAVIFTNGRRQVVGLQQLFQVGDTTFKLLSVGPKSIKVAVTIGGFKGGTKEITITRNKPVTLQNNVTGAQYALNFTLPMSAVPASSSTTGK